MNVSIPHSSAARLATAGCHVTLCCPRDRAPLRPAAGNRLACPQCGAQYPMVRGVPVLIDDDTSVFTVADFENGTAYEGAAYGTAADSARGVRRFYRNAVARLRNRTVPVGALPAREAIARMRAESPDAPILVIGAGDSDYAGGGIVYSDVAFGRNTMVICDAHALPFPDGTFGGIVCVAVLEHVADPWRCAREIWRTLAPRGLVYAVTPFLQPVHMGAHDFTRFTYLGHRRLFRWFEDIDSGVALGPAAGAGFMAEHLLACLSDRRSVRRVLRLAGTLISAAVRPLDRLLCRRTGAYDAASGVFFFGRKADAPITDRALLALYRGAQAG